MGRELNKKIRQELFKNADLEYKKFQSNLCPNNDNILGVRLPVLRKYAKELEQLIDVKEYIKNASDEYYEEVMLQGLIIGYAKLDINTRLELLDMFVPKIDNWAVCDSSITTFKFTNKNLEIVWKYIEKYLNSDKEFETRFTLIMMLDYYLTDEYVDKVIERIDSIRNIESKEYYVKMGVAWLISMIYVKYPEKVMAYINNNKLDDFTYNKSLQKIIESNRVSKEEKDKIRALKRK